MKKIVSLIGSRKGESSNTKKLSDMLAAKLRQHSKYPIQYEVLTAAQWNIRPCLSCLNCFRRGSCVLDNQDDMARIRQSLLEADVVFLGSPVFAAHVSGDAKQLIDRLSMWLHIMPLIGSIGIPLATASNNHGEETLGYLTFILETLGAYVPASLCAYIHKGNVLLNDRESLEPALESTAVKVVSALDGAFAYPERQALHFEAQSRRYGKARTFAQAYPAFRIGEERLWDEQGYFSCPTIHDAHSLKQHKR